MIIMIITITNICLLLLLLIVIAIIIIIIIIMSILIGPGRPGRPPRGEDAARGAARGLGGRADLPPSPARRPAGRRRRRGRSAEAYMELQDMNNYT